MPLTFSYSQARMLQNCPMSYELSYVKEIAVPKSSDLFLGNVLHHTIATFYKMKMDKMILERKDMVDLFAQNFNRLANAEPVNWKGSEPSAVRDMGIALIELYYPTALNLIPLAVEEEFSTELEVDGEKLVITGVLDLIDIASIPYDLKTSSRLAKKVSAISMLQPCFYAICLGAKQLDNFVFHNLVKANLPFFTPTRVAIKEEHITWVREIAIPLWVRQIRSGLFPPNVNACDWCDFKAFQACKGFL